MTETTTNDNRIRAGATAGPMPDLAADLPDEHRVVFVFEALRQGRKGLLVALPGVPRATWLPERCIVYAGPAAGPVNVNLPLWLYRKARAELLDLRAPMLVEPAGELGVGHG